MKFLRIFLFLFFLLAAVWFLTISASASHCGSGDYDCQIQEIQREFDALSSAHEKNKEELANLKKQLDDLKRKIASISSQLKKVESEIAQREEDLAYAQRILDEKALSQYIDSRLYDPILTILASSDASEAFRRIRIKGIVADEDRKTIEKYAQDLLDLKADKENLEKSKASLASLQAQVNEKATFLEGEVAEVETYLSSLSSKQNELKALKAGGFQISVGDVPPSLEPCSGPSGSSNFCDPSFRPAFGGFSFGAPHRKGMSQYGAFGRARAGQNYETILKAYYGDVRIVDVNTSLTIKTSAGAMDFEGRYLPGIAEMPTSWGDENGMEALKAQAIAARSYALSYVGWRMGNQNAGGTICVTENCQVWKSSKADSPGKWKEAVDATRGKIMVGNGSNEVVNSWYASTAGGYTLSYTSLGHSTPGQWDADGGQGGWPNNAWDKKGGSPWFYKGWYKARSGAACGRSHPWLTSEEMADILNARYVLDGKGGDKSRISPVDTSCWGGNPYSMAELRSIGGFTSVSSVSVIYGNDGSTLSVSFQTNKGTESVSGSLFKEAFNLRAPGYIGLKSSLFNIEKL